MLTRRTFIKTLAAVGGVILTPFDWLNRRGVFTLSHIQAPSVGELYAGFLLLPERAPIPPIVEYPEPGVPLVCGVGNDQRRLKPTSVSRSLTSAADLAREVNFRIYTFNQLPDGLRPRGAKLVRYTTGKVFIASVNFESFDAIGDGKGMVSITAQPYFPRPFPLKSSDPVEPGGPAVVLEKVNFLPSPGIMVATQTGYVFHWIGQDVLYTLMAEHNPSREEAQTLIGSLVSIE